MLQKSYNIVNKLNSCWQVDALIVARDNGYIQHEAVCLTESLFAPLIVAVVLLFLFLVDLLSLSAALESFDSYGLRAQNDKLIDVPGMATVLTSLYELIAADNPSLVNVPLCLDLTINWLLNIYDR